jgi:hypothetical protein
MLSAQSGGAKVMPKNHFTGVSNEARQALADKRAAKLAPVLKELRTAGVTSLRGIAAALNERGIPTATGYGRWHHVQVPGSPLLIEPTALGSGLWEVDVPRCRGPICLGCKRDLSPAAPASSH